jgi:hypothetical protein
MSPNISAAPDLGERPEPAQPGHPDASRRRTAVHPEPTRGPGTKRQISSTNRLMRRDIASAGNTADQFTEIYRN